MYYNIISVSKNHQVLLPRQNIFSIEITIDELIFQTNSFLLSNPNYKGTITNNGHRSVLEGPVNIVLEIIDSPMGALIDKKYRKEINKQILKGREFDFGIN